MTRAAQVAQGFLERFQVIVGNLQKIFSLVIMKRETCPTCSTKMRISQGFILDYRGPKLQIESQCTKMAVDQNIPHAFGMAKSSHHSPFERPTLICQAFWLEDM